MIDNNNVLISVVIPVYNSEKYLRRCIESIINQSFENYEIVAVNNNSTDGSLEILRQYEIEYPDKVKVYSIIHSERAGTTRNVGIEKANGEFIAFCDSDDMWDYNYLKYMYHELKYFDADVCLCGYSVIENGTIDKKLLKLPTNQLITNEKAILNGGTTPWNKLCKKELIEEIGGFSEDFCFEDFSFSICLLSYAKKIVYINKCLYYYYLRFNSEGNTKIALKNLDSCKAEDYVCKNGNEYYGDSIHLKVMQHIAHYMRINWVYREAYIKQLHKYWKQGWGGEFLKKRDKACFNYLERFLYLSNKPFPHTIYVNDFNGTYDEEYEQRIEKAFYNQYEVIELNEENCNINENLYVYTAYNNENYSEVAKYFALKYICEKGGIYISEKMVIDIPLNYLTYFHAFFAYADQKHLMSEIFGGNAENKILRSIFYTYNKVTYENDNLAERIKNILICEENVKLSGLTTEFLYSVALYGAEVFYFNMQDMDKMIPELHFAHTLDIEQIPVKKMTDNFVMKSKYQHLERNNNQLRLLENKKRKQIEELNHINESLKKVQVKKFDTLRLQNTKLATEREHLKTENDRLSDENQWLFSEIAKKEDEMKTYIMENDSVRQRLYEIENSKSWRYTELFRKLLWVVKRKHEN